MNRINPHCVETLVNCLVKLKYYSRVEYSFNLHVIKRQCSFVFDFTQENIQANYNRITELSPRSCRFAKYTVLLELKSS